MNTSDYPGSEISTINHYLSSSPNLLLCGRDLEFAQDISNLDKFSVIAIFSQATETAYGFYFYFDWDLIDLDLGFTFSELGIKK